jgi:hypothetical protein
VTKRAIPGDNGLFRQRISRQTARTATLKLAGYQAIRGIDRVVLPTGMSGLVTRLLQRQLQLPLCSRCLARLSFDRLGGGIETERFQNAQHLRADGRS